jgi:hypothetical protein
MLGARLPRLLVLQHAVVDDPKPVPCQHRDDLAVPLALRELVRRAHGRPARRCP